MGSDPDQTERGSTPDGEAAVSGMDQTLLGSVGTRPSGSRTDRSGRLDHGDLVGRYVILSRLGAGAMGVVYAAYDPQLDRKIALKLMLPSPGAPPRSERDRLRLLREAQALAKLNHPNVVSIHDVGALEDRIWIAMEFVDGVTLGEWATQRPRPWPEVLDVMHRAGRGLRAAHAAGILHRDFKPDNVMVDRDGRVRVMDFGLARADPNDSESTDSSGDSPDLEPHSLDQVLTQAGVLVGTPAYMAPEQFEGARLSAAADQFAFSVTLWELLYGERPFSGETIPELADAVLSGRIDAPAHAGRVPGWLRRVCEQGLSTSPQQRHASLDALLAALGTERRRVKLRRGLLAVGALAIVGLGIEGYRTHRRTRAIEDCELAGQQRVETLWNNDAREQVQASLQGTGVSFAESTIDRVLPSLDATAERLRHEHAEVCVIEKVHADWAPDLLERGHWCLDERELDLYATIDALHHADARIAQRAIIASSTLVHRTSCTDATSLERRGLPPVRGRDAIPSVLERFSLARAALLFEDRTRASAEADAALEAAQALEWSPLVARALVYQGRAQRLETEYEQSARSLRDAYLMAAEAGATEIAAEAAVQAAITIGAKQHRHDAGLLWGRLAEMELSRLDLPDDDLRWASLWSTTAIVHRTHGEIEQSQALNERALALRMSVLGPEHIDVAASLNNLAATVAELGDLTRSSDLSLRALAIVEKAFGPDHPRVAMALSNLAAAATVRGDLEQAESLSARALAIWEASLGPEHPNVAVMLFNMAVLEGDRGDTPKAEALFRRALAIQRSALGEDHPVVTGTMIQLARARQRQGELVDAQAILERALATQVRTLGNDHADLLNTLTVLSEIELALGHHEPARTHAERALELARDIHGPEHVRTALAVGLLAQFHRETGDYSTALRLAQQATDIVEHIENAPEHVRVVLRLGLADSQRLSGSLTDAKTSYEHILESAEGPPSSGKIAFVATIGLSALARLQDLPDEAIRLAQRAVEQCQADALAAKMLALGRFTLAQAQWSAGRGRPALDLAREVADGLEARRDDAALLARATQWLADREAADAHATTRASVAVK